MDVTITELPQHGENKYQLEINAAGAGPLTISSNEVSPDGSTRTIKAQQNTDGTNPVNTATFTKLASETTIVANIYDGGGEKIGDGQKEWD